MAKSFEDFVARMHYKPLSDALEASKEFDKTLEEAKPTHKRDVSNSELMKLAKRIRFIKQVDFYNKAGTKHLSKRYYKKTNYKGWSKSIINEEDIFTDSNLEEDELNMNNLQLICKIKIDHSNLTCMSGYDCVYEASFGSFYVSYKTLMQFIPSEILPKVDAIEVAQQPAMSLTHGTANFSGLIKNQANYLSVVNLYRRVK